MTNKNMNTISPTLSPKPHQIEAIKLLSSSKGFLLTDDMGLGKTLTALWAAQEVGEHSPTIICPASLTSNWQAEARKIGSTPQVYSYAKGMKITEVPRLIILDESHSIKSPTSKRGAFYTALCQLVRQRGGRVWLLSGTPVTRDTDDYYNQLLAIGAVPIAKSTGKPWTVWGWKKAVMKEVSSRWKSSGVEYIGITPQGERLLAEQKAGKVWGRKKEEVLDLPGKVKCDICLGLPTGTLKRALATIGLKAQDYSLEQLEEDPAFMTLKKELAAFKAAKVAKLLIEELSEGKHLPRVIFTDHVASANIIAEAISKWGHCKVGLITGETPADERRRTVDRFQLGYLPVLVATIGAAGVGITLTKSCDIRFVDRNFSPALNRQAEDRVYRMGQTQKVVVTDYRIDDPIEDRICELLAEKDATIAKI